MKIGKNSLGSWIQGSAESAESWEFFSKFWFGKNIIGSDVKGDISVISYNRK